MHISFSHTEEWTPAPPEGRGNDTTPFHPSPGPPFSPIAIPPGVLYDNDTLREVPHPSNEGLALQARVSGPWPHKKESVLLVYLARWQSVQVQTVGGQIVSQRDLRLTQCKKEMNSRIHVKVSLKKKKRRKGQPFTGSSCSFISIILFCEGKMPSSSCTHASPRRGQTQSHTISLVIYSSYNSNFNFSNFG